MTTLRWRLTRTVLTIVLPLWAVIGSVAWWSVLHELDEIYDAQVRDLIRPLGELPTPALIGYVQRAQDAPRDLDGPPDVDVMVWDERGALLYRSPDAPSISFADRPRSDAPAAIGHSEPGAHHRVRWWHQPQQARWLAVSIPLKERDELALAMGVGLALPLVLTGVLMWPLMWWGVSRALRPLREVVLSVGQRTGHDLTPITVNDLPHDIEPLVTEVNALLVRLQEALQREQRFTADASHELRTPLAGVAAQLDAARGADTPAARHQALDKAGRALHRATDLAAQLMLLARLDHHTGLAAPVPGWRNDIDMGALCREVMAEEFESAHAAQVELALDVVGGAALPALSGQPVWLHAALRNVVHNAIGHAPPGSEVLVRVQALGGALCVWVVDQGPGLPAALRSLVGQRFARGADAHLRPGSGLGLSIVRRVLDLHGGDWAFSEGPGLTVTLRWPLRQP
jgi:two-component system sensor histidine kinase QseC